MFAIDRFIEDCLAQQRGGGGQPAIRELLASALGEPGAVLRAVGEPTRAGIHKLHHSDELTVLNLVWGPYMTLMPHDHRMWAVIGIYTGREDNIFWRRVGEPGETRVEAAGAKGLATKDCEMLGRDIVHSVTNPIPRLTGAIHVYGGDFFNTPRSEWDPETLRERTYSVDGAIRLFEASNERLQAS